MNKTKKRPDFYIIIITFFLLMVGIIMVFSASSYMALVRYQNSYYFLTKQLTYAAIGLFLFLVIAHIDYHIYQKKMRFILFLTILFLLLAYIPGLSKEINGASRWLSIGSFTIQPSEFAKIGLIIYTATIMVKKQPHLNSFMRSTIPPLIIIGLTSILILMQPHYSATLIIILICITIMFCAGTKIRHLLLLATTGIPVLITTLYLADYRINRLKTIFDTSNNMLDEKY
ncbi:MAG: putative lipid flippase FtsW, partial [Bacillota bacterium]